MNGYPPPPPPLQAHSDLPPDPEMRSNCTAEFKHWLQRVGAEILAPKRGCEALRFKHAGRIGQIIKNKYDRYDLDVVAKPYFAAFALGAPVPARKQNCRTAATHARLIERDGGDCFYCGLSLGQDVTIEHLLPKRHNGAKHDANLCLAHKACNNAASDRPIAEKIALREEKRLCVRLDAAARQLPQNE